LPAWQRTGRTDPTSRIRSSVTPEARNRAHARHPRRPHQARHAHRPKPAAHLLRPILPRATRAARDRDRRARGQEARRRTHSPGEEAAGSALFDPHGSGHEATRPRTPPRTDHVEASLPQRKARHAAAGQPTACSSCANGAGVRAVHPGAHPLRLGPKELRCVFGPSAFVVGGYGCEDIAPVAPATRWIELVGKTPSAFQPGLSPRSAAPGSNPLTAPNQCPPVARLTVPRRLDTIVTTERWT